MASPRRLIGEVGLLVVGFALAGLLAGLLWYAWWSPAPTTDVYLIDGGRPLFDRDVIFRGTGLYFLLAAAVGLVLGALAMWLLDRDELVTLITVVVAALIGGLVMAGVGHLLSPDAPASIDPRVSRRLPDGEGRAIGRPARGAHRDAWRRHPRRARRPALHRWPQSSK